MRPAVPLYWRCTPTVCGALLHVAGLVDHQDRARVAERVDDVVAQIVADRVGVPAGPRQQMLQPVRGGCAAVLGDGPAILAVQARDHPGHQLAGMPQRFVAGEIAARSDRSPPRTPSATDQGLRYEPRRPRRIQLSSQTPNNAAVTAPDQRRHARTTNPDLRLQY